MRILFITPQSPYPPHKGTSTRNYNLIKSVSAHHDVHLLTFCEPPAGRSLDSGPRPGMHSAADALPEEQRQHLARFCSAVQGLPIPARSTRDRLRTTLTSPHPDLALRLASPAFTAQLAVTLSRYPFDILQVEGLEMVPHWFSLAHLATRHPGPAVPKILLDAHNAEYVLQRRAFINDVQHPRRWAGAAYSFVQWLKLRKYEAEACRRAHGVIAVSANDQQALNTLASIRRLITVPNGIDTEYFRPAEVPREKHSLVFTGTMDFRPNVDAVVWFCQEVFPLVRSRIPDAVFYIVGQKPKAQVQALASLPGIVVTGAVDDVRPFLWKAALCVVPLRVGGGTRFKILEALACGTPVVSTRLGAEGIPLGDGEHALLADSPADLAAAVVSLLLDPARAASLAVKGRNMVVAGYEWSVLAKRLLSFYDEL